jgi:hypothetical protein
MLVRLENLDGPCAHRPQTNYRESNSPAGRLLDGLGGGGSNSRISVHQVPEKTEKDEV